MATTASDFDATGRCSANMGPLMLAGGKGGTAWVDRIVDSVGSGGLLRHRASELSGRPTATGGRGPGPWPRGRRSSATRPSRLQ